MFTYNHFMLTNHVEKIKSFYKLKKRLPTYAEVLRLTGLRSKNSVHKLMQKMLKLGLVSQDKTGKFAPQKLGDSAVKLLGVVTAGFPSPAEEELLDTLTLDEYLMDRPEATYLVKVKGDSMKDAGIVEGDMILVERGREARDGDIVVAEIDGEWTLKFLRKGAKGSFLEPANAKYKPIYPKQSLKIGAVVRAVVRKYV